jgi:membrane associated rhomboid family serine protease
MAIRRARNWAELEASTEFPIATVAVLAITITLTLIQIAAPQLRFDLWRDPDALESGQLWRLATPLLIQYDPWWNAVSVLLLIGFVGTATERIYGSASWLVIYLACGITGQAFGYLWRLRTPVPRSRAPGCSAHSPGGSCATRRRRHEPHATRPGSRSPAASR